jgi:hypothetical protein
MRLSRERAIEANGHHGAQADALAMNRHVGFDEHAELARRVGNGSRRRGTEVR